MSHYDETGHFEKNRDAPILRQHYRTQVGVWKEKPKGKAMVGPDAHVESQIKVVGLHQLLQTLKERFNSRRDHQFDPIFRGLDEFGCGIISRANLARALAEMGVQAADSDMADLFDKYRKRFPQKLRTFMDPEGFDYRSFLTDMQKYSGPLDAHRGNVESASKIAQLGLQDKRYAQAIAKHSGYSADQLDAQRLGLQRFETALREKLFRRGSFKLEQIMRRACINRQPYLTKDEFCDSLREFEFNGVQADFDDLFDKYAEEENVLNQPKAGMVQRTWGLTVDDSNRFPQPGEVTAEVRVISA